ncbi:MAG: V-type ATP synthase subunit A [Defluviitaleaceae bacterium]|nr:V-type ATP synthase subunit A [Defluviitaleaceae bacterium]MCL2263824.1 V-type ATP synthase subunit A [Defluviitaleaceae bacterium]
MTDKNFGVKGQGPLQGIGDGVPKVLSIKSINGPVLKISGENFAMAEMVSVNDLPGEVIALKPNEATVQLYENTAGLTQNAHVQKTGQPMSLTIQPGIIGGIFDGIMRPLQKNSPDKIFPTKITAQEGQSLNEGDIFAETADGNAITYRAMLPPETFGTVTYAAPDGEYRATDKILTLETPNGSQNFTLSQAWPIRVPRPVKRELTHGIPLITGIRIIDSLFPITKGGTCAIPGGFGTGKTSTQHQIAKYCDADIIIYIGCGERGNEMTDVLESFAKLKDPRTNLPLLARTALIANTSDMPVAAREASIYTGITLAECYRDMGYNVAVMADSTSRWAEALRELSGRLEEIPAEEGYPAYLAARLAAFYSRAGYVENLNGTNGSVTIIGAVSPQGGDFSEPVTLHTKRFTRCFWALDRKLAYARQFPAINPLQSYSEYQLDEWLIKNVNPLFPKYRNQILEILFKENELMETVKLVGTDTLSPEEQTLLHTAKTIRETFTAQNFYNAADTFTPLQKQFEMMEQLLQLCRDL